MRSSSRALLAASALACAGWAAAADLKPASTALCRPEQKVVFHCSVGAKSVSLCAGMAEGRITGLDYRFGTRARIELLQVAGNGKGSGSGNGNGSARPFMATQSQLAPGARVRQVWFDRAGHTYVVSQCVGGDCPYDAGLAVLRGDQVVSNRRCLRSADDRASFAPELARFGADAGSSQSHTELLVFDDIELGVDRLYPTR